MEIILLIIADLHDWTLSELEYIRELEYDCCCLLGDIPEAPLKVIKQLVQKPIFGVLGNHDTLTTLSDCGIADLNNKSVTINGVTLAGFGCSNRYKPGEYPMLTQKESIAVAANCPPCDILISHDTAFGIMKRKDNAHCGLKGISNYIKRRKPKLNICGHYHENIHQNFKHCDILCIYRCALVTFPSISSEIIF